MHSNELGRSTESDNNEPGSYQEVLGVMPSFEEHVAMNMPGAAESQKTTEEDEPSGISEINFSAIAETPSSSNIETPNSKLPENLRMNQELSRLQNTVEIMKRTIENLHNTLKTTLKDVSTLTSSIKQAVDNWRLTESPDYAEAVQRAERRKAEEAELAERARQQTEHRRAAYQTYLHDEKTRINQEVSDSHELPQYGRLSDQSLGFAEKLSGLDHLTKEERNHKILDDYVDKSTAYDREMLEKVIQDPEVPEGRRIAAQHELERKELSAESTGRHRLAMLDTLEDSTASEILTATLEGEHGKYGNFYRKLAQSEVDNARDVLKGNYGVDRIITHDVYPTLTSTYIEHLGKTDIAGRDWVDSLNPSTVILNALKLVIAGDLMDSGVDWASEDFSVLVNNKVAEYKNSWDEKHPYQSAPLIP